MFTHPTHPPSSTSALTSCFCPKISRAKRIFVTQNTSIRKTSTKKNRVILLHSRTFQHSETHTHTSTSTQKFCVTLKYSLAERKKTPQPRHVLNQQRRSRVEQQNTTSAITPLRARITFLPPVSQFPPRVVAFSIHPIEVSG